MLVIQLDVEWFQDVELQIAANKDQVTLMQLRSAVAEIDDIEQGETLLRQELHYRKHPSNRGLDYNRHRIFEKPSAPFQNLQFGSVNVHFNEDRSLQWNRINTVRLVRTHPNNPMQNTAIRVIVRFKPFVFRLNKYVLAIGESRHQTFGIRANSNINDGSNAQ